MARRSSVSERARRARRMGAGAAGELCGALSARRPLLRSPPPWLFCSGKMSGVGAAILEPQEHAQSESVRVYLSQSILPAITEALTAMEKERCPNPVPHPFAALLDKHACVVAQSSRTTSHLACGQARGASQSEIIKLSRLYIRCALGSRRRWRVCLKKVVTLVRRARVPPSWVHAWRGAIRLMQARLVFVCHTYHFRPAPSAPRQRRTRRPVVRRAVGRFTHV